MTAKTPSQQVIWFSRILRWALGGLFIFTGIWYLQQGGWPVIIFGGIIFITGFFKPRRCLDEGCELPGNHPS
jgi:hypothetical protein